MFREIRKSERITDRFEEKDGYKKIKPVEEMTEAELEAEVQKIFAEASLVNPNIIVG